jgi:hypothetical protein
MRSIGRLLILFFTRPIKLSDLDFLRLLKKRSLGAIPQKRSVVNDFAPTQIVDQRSQAVDAWGRSLGTDVSEQPIHTLPAELQSEFVAGKNAKGS